MFCLFAAISNFDDDERFLYRTDGGGDELWHICVREFDGSTTDLTPGEGRTSSFAGWSGDRTAFYAATNEPDPQLFDVYRYETTGDYAREFIYRNEDGRYVAFVRVNCHRVNLL